MRGGTPPYPTTPASYATGYKKSISIVKISVLNVNLKDFYEKFWFIERAEKCAKSAIFGIEIVRRKKSSSRRRRVDNWPRGIKDGYLNNGQKFLDS
jgi:hypothetical protein